MEREREKKEREREREREEEWGDGVSPKENSLIHMYTYTWYVRNITHTWHVN